MSRTQEQLFNDHLQSVFNYRVLGAYVQNDFKLLINDGLTKDELDAMILEYDTNFKKVLLEMKANRDETLALLRVTKTLLG